MSYTLFNVPMYNRAEGNSFIKKKRLHKNNCSSKAEFYFDYYR